MWLCPSIRVCQRLLWQPQWPYLQADSIANTKSNPEPHSQSHPKSNSTANSKTYSATNSSADPKSNRSADPKTDTTPDTTPDPHPNEASKGDGLLQLQGRCVPLQELREPLFVQDCQRRKAVEATSGLSR